MRQKIYSLALALVAACSLASLTGCSSIDSSAQRIGVWAGGARAALPLLPAHSIHREQSYPVSSQAPIYVHGSDPALVEALARELRLYFGSVALLQGAEPPTSGGFALVLHSASEAEPNRAEPAPVDSPAAPGASVQASQRAPQRDQQQAQRVQQPSLQAAPARYNRQMQISITDRHSNATFDRVTIDLFSAYQSDSAAAHKKIQRAFKHAAALLAGHS